MSRTRKRPGWAKGEQGREFRARLAARDGACCFYCRRPFADLATATLDHFLPWSLWPVYRRFNLVLACEPCNLAKDDALPIGLLLVLRQRFGLAA